MGGSLHEDNIGSSTWLRRNVGPESNAASTGESGDFKLTTFNSHRSSHTTG